MTIHAKPSDTSSNIDHLKAAVDSRQLTDCSQQSSFDLALVPTAHVHRRTTMVFAYKLLSYRREIALQGALVMAKSGRLELGYNIYG